MTYRRRRFAGGTVSIAAALALACVSRPASDLPMPLPTATVAEDAVESGRVPSIAYAVVRSGRVEEARTLGSADLETGTPATAGTRYEAASLTKPIVALLALQLVEEGALSLDESSLRVDRNDAVFPGRQIDGRVARGHFGRSPDRQAWLSDVAIPAYSLITTAEDYGRFLAFVADGAGLGRGTLSEARRTQIEVPRSFWRGPHGPDQIGWSLGWGVLERADGRVFFQWGDNGAFRAFAAYTAPESGPTAGLVFFVNGSLGLLETDGLAGPVLGDISAASRWFSSAGLESLRLLVRY